MKRLLFDVVLMTVVLVFCGSFGCAGPDVPPEPVASVDAELRITPSADGTFRQPGSDLAVTMETKVASEIHWTIRNAKTIDADTGAVHEISADDMRSYFSAASGTGRNAAAMTAHSVWRRVVFTLDVRAIVQTPDGIAVQSAVQQFCLKD